MRLNYLLFAVSLFSLFAACTNGAPKATEPATEEVTPPIVGG